MLLHAGQPICGLTPSLPRTFIDPEECGDERTYQPRPHSALVIGRVTLGDAAFVSGTIARVRRRKRAQAPGSEQMLPHGLNDSPGALTLYQRVVETDCEDLVRPDGIIL